MRACFLALFLLFSWPVHAAGVSDQKANDFVLALFEGFQDIYSPGESNTKQALLNYYDQHFDHDLIARFVFGGYGRRASKPQLARFRELLPKFLLSQLETQIQEYLAEKNTITVLAVNPLKKNHVMVQTIYKGAKNVEINVRLGPVDYVLKVGNIQVAGISMLLAQRDLIATMIKQNNGDIDAFLVQLAEKSKI